MATIYDARIMRLVNRAAKAGERSAMAGTTDTPDQEIAEVKRELRRIRDLLAALVVSVPIVREG